MVAKTRGVCNGGEGRVSYRINNFGGLLQMDNSVQ